MGDTFDSQLPIVLIYSSLVSNLLRGAHMLEIRYKKNSESNILTSVILVMLMVMSTTLAMMIPTEWDEPETVVEVE